jgi:hypothetical protein
LAGETEVLRENLPPRHTVHHKYHMTRPGFEPGPLQWEARDYFFYFVWWDFGYCGHYWPIVPAPDDR